MSQTPTTDAVASYQTAESADGKTGKRLVVDAEFARKLERALRLHLQFLDTLPKGWLGKTVANIGLLNEAFLASSAAGVNLSGKPALDPMIRVYPMGGGVAERVQCVKPEAFHSHAVRIEQDGTMTPLCRVKLRSLCLDDSQCEPAPSCPICAKRFNKL